MQVYEKLHVTSVDAYYGELQFSCYGCFLHCCLNKLIFSFFHVQGQKTTENGSYQSWAKRTSASSAGGSAAAKTTRSGVRSPARTGKKLSRLSHVQSTVEPGLTHKATGPRVRVGQGFEGFLGLLWEGHSTSQTMPWGRSHPRRSSFFKKYALLIEQHIIVQN